MIKFVMMHDDKRGPPHFYMENGRLKELRTIKIVLCIEVAQTNKNISIQQYGALNCHWSRL